MVIATKIASVLTAEVDVDYESFQGKNNWSISFSNTSSNRVRDFFTSNEYALTVDLSDIDQVINRFVVPFIDNANVLSNGINLPFEIETIWGDQDRATVLGVDSSELAFDSDSIDMAIEQTSLIETPNLPDPPLSSPTRMTATLTPDQEVEASNNLDAQGTSVFQLNGAGDALSYELTVFGLDFGQFIGNGTAFTTDTSDDVTKVHIHNAARGENGPLAFALIDLGDLSVNDQDNDDFQITQNQNGSVTLSGIWESTDPAAIPLNAFVDEIRTADSAEELPLYWNVHTEGSPSGAIRGQLQESGIQPPVDISSVLTPDQEVEASNNPDARGISALQLDGAGDALSYELTVFGLDFGQFIGNGTAFTTDTSDDVTKVHIHNAARGENGPLAFALIDLGDLSVNDQDNDDFQITQNQNGSVTLSGIWESTDPAAIPLNAFVDEIRTADSAEELPLYWNVHTEGSPTGAIRGQLQADVLRGELLIASPNTSILEGTTGADLFVIDQSVVQDDLSQSFFFTNVDGADDFEFGSATFISTNVLRNDILTASLSSGDTLTFVGDIDSVLSEI